MEQLSPQQEELAIESVPHPTEYPELIGNNQELWEQYHEEFGAEAYRFRRLYEEARRQLDLLYDYAENNNIELPNPGPSFT